jgi:hypothetical protein
MVGSPQFVRQYGHILLPSKEHARGLESHDLRENLIQGLRNLAIQPARTPLLRAKGLQKMPDPAFFSFPSPRERRRLS